MPGVADFPSLDQVGEGTEGFVEIGIRVVAKAGIPLYWIIELDPDPKVTVLSLGEGGYELAAEVRAGHVFSVEDPFPVSFDPVVLTELD